MASKPVGGNWYVGIDQSLTHFAAVAIQGLEDDHPELMLITSDKRGPRRLAEIRYLFGIWLDGLEHRGRIAHIAMEGYANGARFGREAAGAIGEATKLWLYDHFGDELVAFPTVVEPMQLKAFMDLARPGQGKKQLILKALFQKYGVDLDDDNIADAYVLAQVAASLELGARFEYQRKVLAKIKVHAEWEPPKEFKLRPTMPTGRSSA